MKNKTLVWVAVGVVAVTVGYIGYKKGWFAGKKNQQSSTGNTTPAKPLTAKTPVATSSVQ